MGQCVAIRALPLSWYFVCVFGCYIYVCVLPFSLIWRFSFGCYPEHQIVFHMISSIVLQHFPTCSLDSSVLLADVQIVRCWSNDSNTRSSMLVNSGRMFWHTSQRIVWIPSLVCLLMLIGQNIELSLLYCVSRLRQWRLWLLSHLVVSRMVSVIIHVKCHSCDTMHWTVAVELDVLNGFAVIDLSLVASINNIMVLCAVVDRIVKQLLFWLVIVWTLLLCQSP